MTLYVGLGLAAAWLGKLGGRLVHWSVGAFLFWLVFSGLRIFARPESLLKPYGALAMTSADALSAQATAGVLLVSAAALLLPTKHRTLLFASFIYIALTDALLVLVNAFPFRSAFDARGFLGNASVDGCFIAIALPYLGRTARWAPWIGALAILSTGSSSAIAAGAVALGPWYAAPAGIAAWMITGRELLNPNGRFNVWRIAFEWWGDHVSPIFGSGLGTYFLFGPHAQIVRNQASTGIFTVMHSDWLQVLFEQGVLGLALAFCLFVSAWGHSRGEPATRSALLALGTACAINMPFHFFLSACLGTLILRRAFDVKHATAYNDGRSAR